MRSLIGIAALLFSFPTLAIQVIALKGNVKYKNQDGQFVGLKENQTFKTQATFRTGRKSLVLLKLTNGSRVKLNAQTTLSVKDQIEAEVDLSQGSVFVKFNKEKGKSFRLKTRTAVAGVRGTEFFTSYGSNENGDDVWLCVNEGVVRVENLNTKSVKNVKQGEGVGIPSGKETTDPKPLAWTKKLNWNMDSDSDLENTVSIEAAYTDLLDEDYD